MILKKIDFMIQNPLKIIIKINLNFVNSNSYTSVLQNIFLIIIYLYIYLSKQINS